MKLALLGDIAFFGKFSLANNDNLFEYFKEVSEKLKEYDLVIGNLETPFAEDDSTYGFKSAYIKSDPINVELLKYLNINLVNLSNNHIFDFGKISYELTKKILEENKIQYFGVENKGFNIQFQENNIVFDGFCCYSTNPLGIHTDKADGINELNYQVVKDKLVTNIKNNFFTVFSVHCGQEHVNYPNYDHVQLARQLSDVGSYVFYGHHPHVIQGIETVNKSLLAYSLGNFCFDDVYTEKSDQPLIKQTENNKESFILELTIEDNKLVNHKIIPIYLDDVRMVLNKPGILKKIEVYSLKLSLYEAEYTDFRQKLLDDYILSRKKLRNFNWYIKRLNYKSFFMILAARKNAKKYFDNFKRHIDNYCF
jgi:poly-gamma-glutamate synthesis protein (capsule biosynthesis protein)